MTFNPDWHAESGWTHSTQTHTYAHTPFIIQSVPGLSTWINKSPSYLTTQNWISAPTGSGWRKPSAPLFWFCLIQRQNPVFLSDPSSWFSFPGESFPFRVRETYISRHTIHTWSLFPAYLLHWAYIFQRLINRQHNFQVGNKENRIFHIVSL